MHQLYQSQILHFLDFSILTSDNTTNQFSHMYILFRFFSLPDKATVRCEVCEGYVFTPVCHSVHRGCLPQCMLGYTPPGQTPPGLGLDPPGPRPRHPPGQTHTTTAADGMHPTGMHSCYWLPTKLIWDPPAFASPNSHIWWPSLQICSNLFYLVEDPSTSTDIWWTLKYALLSGVLYTSHWNALLLVKLQKSCRLCCFFFLPMREMEFPSHFKCIRLGIWVSRVVQWRDNYVLS